MRQSLVVTGALIPSTWRWFSVDRVQIVDRARRRTSLTNGNVVLLS